MPGHTEKDFEAAIEAGLVGAGGYAKRGPDGYDEGLALFPEDVLGFLQESQGRQWAGLAKLLGEKAGATALDSLAKELDAKGTLHVLRHGFKCYGKTLRMAWFQPNTRMNPQAAKGYASNRLTIARQVGFASVLKRADGARRRCIIDVVLAVNGVPVVTAELKNPLTGQRAGDAVRQYRAERDGRDLLFKFGKRALVHFALDPDEVWMTTRLKGKDTVFLPFNRGHQDGAGNPPVPGNWKTAYLWDEVLQRDSLLEILQRFMHLEVKSQQVKTDKGVRTVKRETLIFPRYHQLDAVRQLTAHAKRHGSGRNYLVHHSAGSGKSNSIAWLAHRLASLHDAEDQKVFHSVIVVTDRRVLDQQLQATIYQFEHKTGVVEKIDENTQQLASALSLGTPIVITTIQKFPFISQALTTMKQRGEGVRIDTAGKRFAVIVDEAHSSQSGETATALKAMLNKDGIEAAVALQFSDQEDDGVKPTEARKNEVRESLKRTRQPNLSFFAFTATPKFKTMALFDEPGADGTEPFHKYTMRQAIQEGFIMDALRNYTSYGRFYGLVKQVEDDPAVPRRKAARALTRFMELHPHNIEQVVVVIIEHFRLHVLHELGGKAKAMVVTDSRLAAVRYKLAFDRYIKEQGYTGLRALVAFSGTVEDPDLPGASYTEVAMNDGLAESELPEAFARDDYRVLLVAEKYLTGFDQPLLQTMYIVRKLEGVHAVQTLSRLNRIAPGKSRTFVLDFVNDEADIYKAFKPYYQTAAMGENADPHRLSALQHELLEWMIFTPEDVLAFADIWYRGTRDHSATEHREMNAVLDAVVQRFLAQDAEEQDRFRDQLAAYRSLYAFLSQVIPYQDSELERLYAFVRNLLTKLPRPGDGQPFTADDEVALRYYRIQQLSEGAIDLSAGEADPLKGPTDLGTGHGGDEAVPLSSLIELLNARFGTEFTAADQLFFDQIRAAAEGNAQIIEGVRANSYADFAAFLDQLLDDLFVERMEGNEEIFSRVMTDKAFRALAHQHLAQQLYQRLRESPAAEREACG